MEPKLGTLRAHWIGWCLVVTGVLCWSAAAVLSEYAGHGFIIASLIQCAGILLALAAAYFFFEHRSQVRQKRIDLAVDWAVGRLRSLAIRTVTTAVEQWQEHPHRRGEYGAHNTAKTFEEARTFVVSRSHSISDYDTGSDSFDSLHWVFRNFEELASYCGQAFRIIGPALMEFGALIRAMLNLEGSVRSEKRIWEEFRTRMNDTPLPREASYNLLVVAELAIRLIDVLDSKNLSGDPEYEHTRRFTPAVLWRSQQWGQWRR